MSDWLEVIAWNEQGLAPAIAQDVRDKTVLMLAWMNRQALQETVRTGYAVYWSRSRQRLWRKGEESGHVQRVLDVRSDCDQDAIVLIVEQTGDTACHTGKRSCFFNRLVDHAWVPTDSPPSALMILEQLEHTLHQRQAETSTGSYSRALLDRGLDTIGKKLAEECAETIMAAKDADMAHVTREICDLWFHSMVLMRYCDIDLTQVLAELKRRQGVSGLEEKRNRPGLTT